MTKRPADDTKLHFEAKPMLCLPDPTTLWTTVDHPVVTAVPLNSYKPEHKRNCPRVFKTSDTLTDAMIRAQKLQASLSHDLPSLIKFMHPSICSGGYSLGLPIKFCENLPSEDCEMILEDAELQLYRTKYLARKKMLSGGWRGFSIAHKLVVGDVVVFQLIAPRKMKVHIVSKGTSVDSVATRGEAAVLHKPSAMEDKADAGNVTDDSANGSPAAVEDVIRFSESNISFKEINCFEDFHIVFDKLIIDCEFTKHMRRKYYELCKSQSMFLHENLLEGINCKLAAGIIIETVSIADAVAAARPSTPKEDVAVWNMTLKAVEGLGMRVQFLREMLCRRIGNRVSDSETGDALLVKLLEVQESARKFHAEIEALRNSK